MVGLALLRVAEAASARVEASAMASDGVAWPLASGMVRFGEEQELGGHLSVARIGGWTAWSLGPEWWTPLDSGRLWLGGSFGSLGGLHAAEASLRWDHDAAERVSLSTAAGWRWGSLSGHELGAAFLIAAYPRPWCSFSSGPQVSFGSEADFHLVFGAEILPIERAGLSLYAELGIPTLYSAGLRWTPGGHSLRDRDRLGMGPARAPVI